MNFIVIFSAALVLMAISIYIGWKTCLYSLELDGFKFSLERNTEGTLTWRLESNNNV